VFQFDNIDRLNGCGLPLLVSCKQNYCSKTAAEKHQRRRKRRCRNITPAIAAWVNGQAEATIIADCGVAENGTVDVGTTKQGNVVAERTVEKFPKKKRRRAGRQRLEAYQVVGIYWRRQSRA